LPCSARLLLAAAGVGWVAAPALLPGAGSRPDSSGSKRPGRGPPGAAAQLRGPDICDAHLPAADLPGTDPSRSNGRGEPGRPADRRPYWSVIVTSAAETDGGRASADASAASLCDPGFTDAFVVFFATIPSLNSGYWVEMETTGKYAHRDDAAATSTWVIAAGFAGAYPRCLGSSATACGS